MDGQKATLRDVINYEQDSYINEADIALIQSTFKDNPRLFRVLRKVMLPSIGDTDLPIEEIGKDAWMSTNWDQIPVDQIKPLIVARQEAIKFIAGGIIQLKIIANSGASSIQELREKRTKDSAK